jgi:iron complex outermembrane recepter protein
MEAMRGTFGLSLQQHLMAGAAIVAVASASPAEAQTRTFDVPAEPAAQGIPQFAKQAGVQIIASGNVVRDRRTNTVRGAYTIEEGLRLLFNGTGLAAGPAGQTGIITIGPSAEGNGSAAAEPATSLGETAAGAAAEVGTTNQSQTIVVVGSRIPQQGKQGAQEVRTYTRKQIDQSGQSSVADFLSILPEVSTSSIDSQLGNYADQTTVRLHGLPTGTTLVLLNGRRVEINNYGFFDLNNVPLSMVERVEVLPVGSSAIYGADSLAGAVNFVLRKDFTGFEANARYGHARGTDEFDGNVGGGYSWDGGSFSIAGSYQSRGELLGSERAISRDPNNVLATFGLGDQCNPGTIYSTNGGNLPGLSSPMAAIPPGLSGKPSISDFNGTAGQVNGCSFNRYSDLLPSLTREGILASGEINLAPWATLFTEVLASHEKVNSRVGNLLSFGKFTLPATNAFNPFGVDVKVSFAYPGLPYRYIRTTTFVRPLVGVRGNLGGGWDYELTGFWSYDKSQVSQNNNENFAALFAALASSDPATALNLFAQGAPGSPQLLSSLFGPPFILRFGSQDISTTGIVRGPLFGLASGLVQAVFGAEYDHSELSTYQQDAAIQSAANASKRNAYSLFSEVHVPLIANRANPHNGDRLAIGLAGRFDHSDDFGSKATGQANFEARPIDSLLIRGGYAMSYQAPLLTQLAGASGSFLTNGLVDPLRGNAPVNSVVQTFGPNPNLRPETGYSRQLGVVYSSKALPGLSASLTLWDIHIANYIGTPTAQNLIDFPQLFPGAVVRAAPSPQDIQNGFPGPITAINDVFFNFGKIKVSGIDFDASYTAATSFGRITPSLSVTETLQFKSSLSPSLPPTSSLSRASTTVGFAPRWKGTAGIGWQSGPYELRVDARYVGRYRDYQNIVRNSNVLGNFILTDANFRYNVGDALSKRAKWLSGAYLEIGGVNLFDVQPQKSFTSSNFDFAEADIRGRFIYLRIGVKR